jgi:hypothetical protein
VIAAISLLDRGKRGSYFLLLAEQFFALPIEAVAFAGNKILKRFGHLYIPHMIGMEGVPRFVPGFKLDNKKRAARKSRPRRQSARAVFIPARIASVAALA